MTDRMTETCSRQTKLPIAYLEFFGVAERYNVSGALANVRDVEVCSFDPLKVPIKAVADTTRRAQAIASTIADTYPHTVALVAVCTGASLIGPISAELKKRGIEIWATALIDPANITRDTVQIALQDIAKNLEADFSETSDIGRAAIDEDSIVWAEGLIQQWVEGYISANTSDKDLEFRAMLDQLRQRYVNWISFLCAAMNSPHLQAMPEVSAVFASNERLDAQLGASLAESAVMHLYDTGGKPCLGEGICSTAFSSWFERAARDRHHR